MATDAPTQGVLRAPAAVRLVDIDTEEDLLLPRADAPYASAYLVGTRGGRPLAARTLEVNAGGLISAAAVRGLFADLPREASATVAPSDALPTLSVVVTTCGKDDSVSQAVASVLACDPGPLEVIVVENRPENSTVAATLAERFAWDPRVSCVSESRAGLSYARNAGLAAAVGEAVAFTDDDVIVDGKWVEWLARGFASGPDVACVTGLILPADLETTSQVQIEQFAGFGKGWQRRVFSIDNPTSALFPLRRRRVWLRAPARRCGARSRTSSAASPPSSARERGRAAARTSTCTCACWSPGISWSMSRRRSSGITIRTSRSTSAKSSSATASACRR
jgi:hypothetical protein